MRESKAVSKGEYGGQQGRFMPPKQEEQQINNFYDSQPLPVQIGPGISIFY